MRADGDRNIAVYGMGGVTKDVDTGEVSCCSGVIADEDDVQESNDAAVERDPGDGGRDCRFGDDSNEYEGSELFETDDVFDDGI